MRFKVINSVLLKGRGYEAVYKCANHIVGRWKKLCCFLILITAFITVFSASGVKQSAAAVITKTDKKYEIAVVFDNSGSMYLNESWCRAKYAMEIFASMLHYDNGDVLKIFPMWEVATDGSMPETGGSYTAIEIRKRDDIDKISNLYTIQPSGTPFAPVDEAYKALKTSGAEEKWLIVLTDGVFNQEERGVKASIELEKRMKDLASSNIKVQYLGIGSAAPLQSDEANYFYSTNTTDASLKDDLINICNVIFQRAVLPEKYISADTITLDMSMKSLIVFAQGSDAKVTGLTAADGTEIPITLDSGQRKYSTISAGGGYLAPADTTLAGQVVTFGECAKGTYTLNYSGVEKLQIFYEPDVDIEVSVTNSDGVAVDYTEGVVMADSYTVSYGIVDSVTGEDVTQSELMGGDVKLNAKLVTSDGTETELTNDGSIELAPDDETKLIVEGTYLKDYRISSEDSGAIPQFKVTMKPEKEIGITINTEQVKSWFNTKEHEAWKPFRIELNLDGEPLSDAQLEKAELNLEFSRDIPYMMKALSGESAYEVYIGTDENGNYAEPDSGKYRIEAEVSLTDEYDRLTTDSDRSSFEVQPYSSVWPWLRFIIILAAVVAAVAFVLSRKTWPKAMYLNLNGGLNDIDIGGEINLASNKYPMVLQCTAKKASRLYQKFGTRAYIKITEVYPAFDVTSFKITTGTLYTKGTNGFTDSNGKPFKEVYVRHGSKIFITRKGRGTIDGNISMNGRR